MRSNAPCQFPVTSPPQRFGDRLLYDAQAVYPVPIQIFEQLDIDILISVDVGLPIENNFKLKTGVDLLFRQNDILCTHVISEVDNCSDLVIRPDIQGIHWTDFTNMDAIIMKGLEAGQKAIPRIKELLDDNYQNPSMKDRPWHNSSFKDLNRVALINEPLTR
jgi:NTE family protein